MKVSVAQYPELATAVANGPEAAGDNKSTFIEFALWLLWLPHSTADRLAAYPTGRGAITWTKTRGDCNLAARVGLETIFE